jgi:anti-sigma factor RsiW
MPNCQSIDPLVTPYVDGQLEDADRQAVDEHVRVCAPCHSRVVAERVVSELIRTRKPLLRSACAPDSLHAKCAEAARLDADGNEQRATGNEQRATAIARLKPRAPSAWPARYAPFAAVASLVLIVGAAFIYQLTTSSTRVLALELAADHMKCFAINGVLRTHESASAVESSMLSSFGWRMHLPEEAPQAGLELIGARPCLYGHGKIAHIMYRHRGEPMSVFMLPQTARAEDVVQVLGHQAAIWCADGRTFVLVTRERNEELQRMASLVRGSLR